MDISPITELVILIHQISGFNHESAQIVQWCLLPVDKQWSLNIRICDVMLCIFQVFTLVSKAYVID